MSNNPKRWQQHNNAAKEENVVGGLKPFLCSKKHIIGVLSEPFYQKYSLYISYQI